VILLEQMLQPLPGDCNPSCSINDPLSVAAQACKRPLTQLHAVPKSCGMLLRRLVEEDSNRGEA
jgi:hypothetical protein